MKLAGYALLAILAAACLMAGIAYERVVGELAECRANCGCAR
jgi:hypothetical protein